jgi:general secretion pathway protein H
MPISVTGTSTRTTSLLSEQRGFSLLELLVVVAIIGIMVGAVVLSIGVVGVDSQIEQETQRLRSMVDLLHEEALMQSRDYGLMLTRAGYRYYVYDYKQLKWIEASGDRLLRERALPKPLEFGLLLDGREVELARDFKSIDRESMAKKEGPAPQIMILSSGELTPFELDLYRDRAFGGHFTLKGELDGTLEIAKAGYDSR